MGTGCGRGRHVPQWTASSTTRPSVRLRAVLRCTSSRYGPNRAWSSHTPRAQNRHVPRAALAQNQQSTYELLYPFEQSKKLNTAWNGTPPELLFAGSSAVTMTFTLDR